MKDASQWIIGYKEEYDLAEEIYIQIYKCKSMRYYWNVKRTSSGLEKLGKQDSEYEYIGRFDLNSNTMHGYPIDHRIDPRQKPDNTALKILKENNKITKTEMIKISRGKAL